MHLFGRSPRRQLGAIILAVAGVAACTGNQSGNPSATTLAPIGTGIVVDTTVATTPPSTTVPGPGSSLDNTAPLSDRAFRFELTEGYASGSTTPIGLVELQQREGTNADGRCYALIGTYTGIRADSLLVSPNVLARAELITDGDASTGDDNLVCDRSTIDGAGWGVRVDARLLPGADFNFASVFFVPSATNLRAIRLFGNDPNAQKFYDPGVLDGLPALPAVRAGASPLNLKAFDDPAVNPFSIGDDYQTIEADIRGVVSGFSRIDGLPGSCVAVYGTMKPTKTIGSVVNSLSIPEVSLIADGNAIKSDSNRCASRDLTRQGWLGLRYAGVATGNTFAFAEFFAVNSDAPILQVVGVGDLFDAETRQLFTPTTVDSVPNPPARERTNPVVPLRPNAESVSTPVGDGTASSVPPAVAATTQPPAATTIAPGPTDPNATGSTAPQTTRAATTAPPTTESAATVNTYTVSGSPVVTIINEATWNAQAYGIVGLPSNADSATCYAILMSWSVSEGIPTDPPPVGLLSSGAYWAPAQTEAQCDPTPLTNAGWQDATQAIFNDVDQAAIHVFVPIFIPSGQDRFGAIGIGNVADNVNVGYVAPVRLAAPPPIPGIVPVTTPPTSSTTTAPTGSTTSSTTSTSVG